MPLGHEDLEHNFGHRTLGKAQEFPYTERKFPRQLDNFHMILKNYLKEAGIKPVPSGWVRTFKSCLNVDKQFFQSRDYLDL